MVTRPAQRLRIRYATERSEGGGDRGADRRTGLMVLVDVVRSDRPPYVERRTMTYPTNPDMDGSLKSLERLRHIMSFPKLGYGSPKIAVLKVNSKTRYPKPFE